MQHSSTTDNVALCRLLAVHGCAFALIAIERMKPATERTSRPGWNTVFTGCAGFLIHGYQSVFGVPGPWEEQ